MYTPTDDPNFKKDSATNAVLNTNTQAYQEYKQRRNGNKKMEEMANEIDELKSLVRALLESKNG